MIGQSKEYQEWVKPKIVDPEIAITSRANRVWQKFGTKWERLRVEEAMSLISASLRLQLLAQTEGIEKALYDARLTIVRGVRDDDPEKDSPERNAVLQKIGLNTSRLYWQAYNFKSARKVMREYYQEDPNRLKRISAKGSELDEKKRRVLEQIINTEKYGIVGYDNLIAQLKNPTPLQFLSYSCLGIVPNRQEISPVVGDSKFFNLWKGRISTLFERLRKAKVIDQVALTVLVADDEPWEIWGWDEDNRAINEPIIDEIVSYGDKQLKKELGASAQVIRYSDFFLKKQETRAKLLDELIIPKNYLEDEKDLYLRLGIPTFTNQVTQSSIRMYVAEGLELLDKDPVTIIGIENPIRQRASLWSLARWENPQPVIHPVKL